MQFKGNYIDLIIILVLLYFITEAWRHGFWVLVADFISFLGSILLSLWLYKFLSGFLVNFFSLSHSVGNAVGFLISAIIIESLLSFALAHLIARLPKSWWRNKVLRFFAVLPALGEGVILVAFILTLAIAFPIKPSVKTDIVESKIGGFILKETSGVERSVNEIFGGVIEESLTYITIKPGSNEKVPLTTSSNNLSVDEGSEKEMFAQVNQERQKLGIVQLSWDARITVVATKYATYMWENHYFGHYSLDGKDVGNRLTSAGIKYEVAGENLALAPDTTIAMTGLMNSQGHRENILNVSFHRVGIGVVDNGIYGKIFVQVFTN